MNLLPARNHGPRLPCRQFLPVLRQEQDTGTPKAGIDTGVILHVLPQAQRLAGQRNLRTRAALLTAPAPVATRLLRPDIPLLDKRNSVSFLRKMIGRRNADDATADDDNISLRGQALVACDAAEWRGHETLLTVSSIEAGWLLMGCSCADRAHRAVRRRGD